jgi:hypothetical protein
MIVKIPDKYSTAVIFLMILGAVLFLSTLIPSFGDLTHAAFVLGGLICAMTGIFILVFSGGEPVDPRFVGILTAQGSVNHCLVTKQLGIQTNACFLPPGITGKSRVVQFNPVSVYEGSPVSVKGSFKDTVPAGLVTAPSCDLLIQDLKKRNAMIVPDREEELSFLLEETISDILKFAERVSILWGKNSVTVTFYAYTCMDGCEIVARESPRCCTISPCPSCSLCGALIAEGLDRVVVLTRCSAGPSPKDVTAVFTILPLPDINP